jgi:phosphatidylserine/phosphatidylglycerophosphate/cardiolipin synthase-like enzyme
MDSLEFLTDERIYQRVILEMVPSAAHFLWIGTSDMKDLYVQKQSSMVPFLEICSDLVKRGVAIRLIHAKEPGPAFRTDFDRYPNLIEGIERLLCPRVHFKSVVVDGISAYSGSANLTGAGLGAKSTRRRNFESGFVTTEPALVSQIMQQFDDVWIGSHCGICDRTQYCADYKDILES